MRGGVDEPLEERLLMTLYRFGSVFLAAALGAAAGRGAAAGEAEAAASRWGFEAEDSTACLQAALDSGARTVRVDNAGSDWIVGPIAVPSDIEIVFADGVVVRAKRGAFQGRDDSLFAVVGRSNVVLRGEGSVLWVMNKGDYQDPEQYKPAEWRHTLRIINSRNVEARNLTLRSSGGDGVYVGGKAARDITLEGLTCEDHHRQGISVTGAENLLMKGCRFNDTKGTPPQCGIVYEPNYADSPVVNCVAEGCEFNGNALAGAAINLTRLDATSRPVSIAFRDCRFRGNPRGVMVTTTGSGTPAAPGRIEFTGCRIEDSAKASFGVSEQQVTNLSFMLRDCVIDNRHSATEAFRISSGHGGDIAGLRIEGLTVIEDDTNRPPIKFIPRLSNGLLDPVVARVRVRNSAGEESAFDGEAFVRASAPLPPDRAFQTRPLDLGALKPLGAQGKRAGEGLRVRRQFEFLQWARAGQTLSIAFTNRPVHRYAGPRYSGPLKVAVWAPSRTVVAEFGIPFDGGTNFVLDARETGIYRFEIDARMQTAGVVSGAPGHGLAAAESLYLFGCSGRLYFYVPAGIRDIRIEAAGATFALLDPDGNPVDSVVNHEGSKILHAVRPDVSRGEVWSVRFTGTTYLRVGAPLAPVLSTDPANVLAWEPAEGAGPREAAGGNETD